MFQEYLNKESTSGMLSPARDKIRGTTTQRQTFIHDYLGTLIHLTQAGDQRLWLNKMDVHAANPTILLVFVVLFAQFINEPHSVKNLKISVDILWCCSISMKPH
jgi:hypothetical protein